MINERLRGTYRPLRPGSVAKWGVVYRWSEVWNQDTTFVHFYFLKAHVVEYNNHKMKDLSK